MLNEDVKYKKVSYYILKILLINISTILLLYFRSKLITFFAVQEMEICIPPN